MLTTDTLRIFVTHNSEYHVRAGTCVAVRDRRTGQWLTQHTALQATLTGSLRLSPQGDTSPGFGDPKVGEALRFVTPEGPFHTTRIMAIEHRPAQARPQLQL